ncbi:MAG: hypothetical protein EB025_06550, partial [Chitinophagaceae bacterium]|nr:hypothetical protein [Chitinophagaceae bacterium]
MKQIGHNPTFHLTSFLEISDAAYYLIYSSQKEKSFFSDKWFPLLGFTPDQVADPIAEKKKWIQSDFLESYEEAKKMFGLTDDMKVSVGEMSN